MTRFFSRPQLYVLKLNGAIDVAYSSLDMTEWEGVLCLIHRRMSHNLSGPEDTYL